MRVKAEMSFQAIWETSGSRSRRGHVTRVVDRPGLPAPNKRKQRAPVKTASARVRLLFHVKKPIVSALESLGFLTRRRDHPGARGDVEQVIPVRRRVSIRFMR